MTLTSVNGRPTSITIDWPPIDEAMCILDASLHHEGALDKLAIRQVTDDPRYLVFYGRMWREVPEEIDNDLVDATGEITAHGTSQEIVVRQLAALIKMSRGLATS